MTLTQEIINSPVVERSNDEIRKLLKEKDFLMIYQYPVGVKIYQGEMGYYKFRRIITKIF